MRMNYTDIKKEIQDNWEQFASNQEPSDLLSEFAESACPIYTSDIIEEWQEMPHEFDDAWQESFNLSESFTIVQLMGIDLFNYYQHQFQTAYNELAEEAFILCVTCGEGIDTAHPFTQFCENCEASE